MELEQCYYYRVINSAEAEAIRTTGEICRKVRIRKYSPDTFRTPNGLKQVDALPLLLFNFALEIKMQKIAILSPLFLEYFQVRQVIHLTVMRIPLPRQNVRRRIKLPTQHEGKLYSASLKNAYWHSWYDAYAFTASFFNVKPVFSKWCGAASRVPTSENKSFARKLHFNIKKLGT
jgi:hypothetical protein